MKGRTVLCDECKKRPAWERITSRRVCRRCYDRSLRQKKGEAATASVKFICEHCGRLNEIEGSYDPETFNLRLRYAECEHCGTPRHAMEIESGCFKCVRCRVVYRIGKFWRPVKGMCMACYMRLYRKKKKDANV